MHPTTEYATKVVYGDVLASKYETLACKRHLNDLEMSKNTDYIYMFDETRADRIYEWFKVCRHVRGPFSGQSIELEDWQKFDLGCIFGWVEKNTGKRKYRTAYIRIARGQAKSTEMSGVANYGMCADAIYKPYDVKNAKYEDMPEVIIGAVDRGQADRVWGDAKQMGENSPGIKKRLNLLKTKISHKARNGSLSKLSKDTKNKDSGAPCIIIIDEYHAHTTSFVKDITASGKGKRSQCLEFIITTAGEDAENSPCKIEDDIVKKILQGEIISESYFGMIREIDDADDPHDKTCWPKANPMFRLNSEYAKNLYTEMNDEYELAYGSGDSSKIRQFLIKRVNRFQVGAENKYFSDCMDKWKSLSVSREEFLKITRGKESWVGVDLSKCIDLTALGNAFELNDGKYAVCAHGFLPEETLKKHEHGDRVPYRFWSEKGWLTITPGSVTDDRFIINHLHETEFDNGWNTKEFCYDPFGARQMSNVLSDEGYICIEIRQSFAMLSEATKKFRELTMQGKIVHDGSPLLTWCLSNAIEITSRGELIMLNKKHKNDTQRIDLIAAILNAFVRAILSRSEIPYSEIRGILEV